jgi:Uma2 family endonuclease
MTAAIERRRMTLAEFQALPEQSRPAEYIEGELIVSPAPKDTHQRTLTRLMQVLLRCVPDDSHLRVAPSDLYIGGQVLQPDIFWIRADSSACRLGEDDYWHGAPDLVVEILSPATASRDKGIKYETYQAAGVREYWLIDPYYFLLEVYTLADGQFRRQGAYDDSSTFVSPVLQAEIATDNIFQ